MTVKLLFANMLLGMGLINLIYVIPIVMRGQIVSLSVTCKTN